MGHAPPFLCAQVRSLAPREVARPPEGDSVGPSTQTTQTTLRRGVRLGLRPPHPVPVTRPGHGGPGAPDP